MKTVENDSGNEKRSRDYHSRKEKERVLSYYKTDKNKKRVKENDKDTYDYKRDLKKQKKKKY